MGQIDEASAATRRAVLASGLAVTAALSLPACSPRAKTTNTSAKGETMGTFKTKDGTEIYFKDWGPKSAQPICFHHGWPLSADDWDNQMMFFLAQGYRVVAHDRRGHGRSTQTWGGNEMDTYADDLLALVQKLDLKDAIHVGHSTGGGEVARFLGRHGTSRAAKAALIGAVPPIMVKSASNPEGTPIEVFDGYRKALLDDRSQLYIDVPTGPFYSFNRPGAKVSEGIIRKWWLQGMTGGVKAHYDCIKAFSETDFTEDLKKIDIPVIVMAGDDDQIVPYKDAALKSAELLPKATLKIYPKLPHGMCTTHPEIINPDLLAFFKS